MFKTCPNLSKRQPLTRERQLEPYYWGSISNNDTAYNGKYAVGVFGDVARKYLLVQNVGASDVIIHGGDKFDGSRFYGFAVDYSLVVRKHWSEAGLVLPPNASIGLSSGAPFVFSSKAKIELNYLSFK